MQSMMLPKIFSFLLLAFLIISCRSEPERPMLPCECKYQKGQIIRLRVGLEGVITDQVIYTQCWGGCHYKVEYLNGKDINRILVEEALVDTLIR
jgi:hypothetical protein